MLLCPRYVLLSLVAAATLAFHVTSSKADDESFSGDDTVVGDDVALGELGSLDDDVELPRARRSVRRAPAPAPRMVIDPSVRVALAHRFAKDLSVELYGRVQLGAVRDPLESRSTMAGGGFVVNKTFGSVVWSNSIEGAEHYRNFYQRELFTSTEVTTALARAIRFDTLPIVVTPRISVGYQWATDRRFERVKTEFLSPVTYKLTKRLDFIVTPRIDWQGYSNRADQRSDITAYLAVGAKYEIASGVSLSGSIGYESRRSNVSGFSFTRWKLAPQISIRSEL